MCHCIKCRFKFTSNFSYETRLVISNEFYGLADRNRQKDFICSTVVEKDVERRIVRMDQPDKPDKRKKKKAPKSKSQVYYLKNEDGVLARVCPQFYWKILGISGKYIDTKR